jgi:CRP-like cAMP-binding protein
MVGHVTDRRSTPLTTPEIDPTICTPAYRLGILRRVPFFAALSDEQLADVNARFHARDYAAGETLYTAGSPAARLHVLALGVAKLTRHTPAGQDVLLDILAPGDIFGSPASLGEREVQHTAEAQTMCCVLSIGADDFRAILGRYPLVALAVLDIVVAQVQAAHDTVAQLSAAPAEARIATALLKLADKLGEPRDNTTLIQTPLSRQDIAALTGTTVETASRVMSRFRRDGLIDSGRQWVAVVDAGRLRAVADSGVRP